MREVHSRGSGLRLVLALGLTVVAGAITVPPHAQAALPCAGRYKLFGDGTVLDNDTKLTWQQIVDTTERNWANADEYCSTLPLPGLQWRLPTIFELQTIVDEDHAYSIPVIDSAAFPSTPATFFWSSSPDVREQNKKWYVDFGLYNPQEMKVGGLVNSHSVDQEHLVRCVR